LEQGRLDARVLPKAGPWAAGEWPGTPRVARGVPDRVARLRALGNALVPQIVTLIGRAILAAERAA
jgi:DNA (cytosine-5)-methyltransferase 1